MDMALRQRGSDRHAVRRCPLWQRMWCPASGRQLAKHRTIDKVAPMAIVLHYGVLQDTCALFR